MVEQMAVTDGVELGLRLGTAHLVEEFPVFIDAEADEVKELLHMIDVIAPLQVGSTRCHDQIFDVGADIPERGLEKGLTGKVLTQLAKDPGVAYAGSADHEPSTTRLVQYPLTFGYGSDVTVG